MSTRKVEIEDTLQDNVDSAIESVKVQIIIKARQRIRVRVLVEVRNQFVHSGAIHEIVDGSVPIYTKEIEDTFYLYGNEIEEAFDNAGIGTKEDKGWPMGWNNAQDVFEEWQEKHTEQSKEKPLPL